MHERMVHERITLGAATLSVQQCGTGEAVVLIPSWARGAEDFTDLMQVLVAAGFRTIPVNPRGVGESTGPLDGARA